jgi:hypothetical protein
LSTLAGDVPVTTFKTDSGLIVNTPSKLDPKSMRLWPNACWDAPLPCTPNPAPNLQLREPGNLANGFKVDGDWMMQDWPYYWRAGFLEEWRMRSTPQDSR